MTKAADPFVERYERWKTWSPQRPDIPNEVVEDLRFMLQGRWYLEHGTVAPVRSVRSGRFGLGRCHSNSSWLGKRWPSRYRIWTGYALGPTPNLDNHSWVQRVGSGEHVEVTWSEPGRFYLGVPVPPAEFRLCTLHPNQCVAFRALGKCRALEAGR